MFKVDCENCQKEINLKTIKSHILYFCSPECKEAYSKILKKQEEKLNRIQKRRFRMAKGMATFEEHQQAWREWIEAI